MLYCVNAVIKEDLYSKGFFIESRPQISNIFAFQRKRRVESLFINDTAETIRVQGTELVVGSIDGPISYDSQRLKTEAQYGGI